MPTPAKIVDRYTKETLLRETAKLLDLLQAADRAARHLPVALAEGLRDREGLEDGMVWSRYIDKAHDDFSTPAFEVREPSGRLSYAARELTKPVTDEMDDFLSERHPSPYRIVNAFIDGVFRVDPRTGKNERAYDVKKLQKYIAAVSEWTKKSLRLTKALQRKVEQIPAAA